MSLYNYTPNPDELYHYGVIGMKWGVRRNASRAFAKATSKQMKLTKRVESTKNAYDLAIKRKGSGKSAKYIKNNAKAIKFQTKADKKATGLFSNEKKAAEYQVKANRYKAKADKTKAKYEQRNAEESRAKTEYAKAMIKSAKWQKSMNKAFKNIDGYHVENGKVYLDEKLKRKGVK